MKFLNIVTSDPETLVIHPVNGESEETEEQDGISVLQGTMSDLEDGAFCSVGITVRCLGPASARVHALLFNANSQALAVAIQDVSEGQCIHMHLSAAQAEISGEVAFSLNVWCSGASIKIIYWGQGPGAPRSNMTILGDFEDAS